MRIKLLMDKRIDSNTAWCGTYSGIFKTIKIIFKGYSIGYRRFDLSRFSK